MHACGSGAPATHPARRSRAAKHALAPAAPPQPARPTFPPPIGAREDGEGRGRDMRRQCSAPFINAHFPKSYGHQGPGDLGTPLSAHTVDACEARCVADARCQSYTIELFRSVKTPSDGAHPTGTFSVYSGACWLKSHSAKHVNAHNHSSSVFSCEEQLRGASLIVSADCHAGEAPNDAVSRDLAECPTTLAQLATLYVPGCGQPMVIDAQGRIRNASELPAWRRNFHEPCRLALGEPALPATGPITRAPIVCPAPADYDNSCVCGDLKSQSTSAPRVPLPLAAPEVQRLWLFVQATMHMGSTLLTELLAMSEAAAPCVGGGYHMESAWFVTSGSALSRNQSNWNWTTLETDLEAGLTRPERAVRIVSSPGFAFLTPQVPGAAPRFLTEELSAYFGPRARFLVMVREPYAYAAQLFFSVDPPPVYLANPKTDKIAASGLHVADIFNAQYRASNLPGAFVVRYESMCDDWVTTARSVLGWLPQLGFLPLDAMFHIHGRAPTGPKNMNSNFIEALGKQPRLRPALSHVFSQHANHSIFHFGYAVVG